MKRIFEKFLLEATKSACQTFARLLKAIVRYDETTAIDLEAKRDLQMMREKHQQELAALSVHSASSATSSATTNTGQNANSNSNANSVFFPDQQSLATLQKAFKFDQSAVDPFKVERNWLAWKRSFTNQCQSFDMQDVLNASFVPAGGDATLLFDRRNLIMMNLLKAKICTVKGREIVNRHLDNGDGQKTFAELSTYYSGPGSIGRKQYLQEPTPSPPLPTAPSDTNEHQAEVNITEMMPDLQAGLHDDDAHWRYEDNFLSDLANREVNQTSHHPTFAMPRFLSQDEESYGIGTVFERYGDEDGSAIREQDTAALAFTDARSNYDNMNHLLFSYASNVIAAPCLTAAKQTFDAQSKLFDRGIPSIASPSSLAAAKQFFDEQSKLFDRGNPSTVLLGKFGLARDVMRYSDANFSLAVIDTHQPSVKNEGSRT
mmetsp:Transcript_15976/g.24860  ORF Transcript_15976/g.24860 Transcript_15976/m.24860 type:complete len:431 (+) Transcript_15976:307-1599(+)